MADGNPNEVTDQAGRRIHLTEDDQNRAEALGEAWREADADISPFMKGEMGPAVHSTVPRHLSEMINFGASLYGSIHRAELQDDPGAYDRAMENGLEPLYINFSAAVKALPAQIATARENENEEEQRILEGRLNNIQAGMRVIERQFGPDHITTEEAAEIYDFVPPPDTAVVTEQVAQDLKDPELATRVKGTLEGGALAVAGVAGLVMGDLQTPSGLIRLDTEAIEASADAAITRTFATDDGKPRTKKNKYVEPVADVAENMFNQRPGPTWRGTVKCDSTAGKKLLAHPGDGERQYKCWGEEGKKRVYLSSVTSAPGFAVYAQGETEKVAHYDGDVEAVTGKQWSVHSFANQASTYVVLDRYKGVRARAGLSRTPSTWGWAENHATVKDKNHPDLIAKSLETGMKATGTTERVGKITEKKVQDTGYTKFVDDDLVSQTVLAITVNTIEKQSIFSEEANDLIVGWKLAGKYPSRTALFTGEQKKLLEAYEDENHGLQITSVDNKTIKVRIPFLGEDEKIAGSDTYSVTWVGGNDVKWTKDNA